MPMRGHPSAPLLIALLLVASPALARTDLSLQAEQEVAASGPRPHPSILIQGDAGFAALGSGVVDGDGSPERPYVIAGWAIVHARASAIRLVDTAKHVVIRDVYLEGQESEAADVVDCIAPPAWCDGSQGITLLNASNVRIENVRVVGETTGIRAVGSRDVAIHDVVVGIETFTPFGPVTAIDVHDSHRVRIVNATLRTYAADLINVRGSTDVVVTDSHLIGSTTQRVGLGRSDGVTFARNRFDGALVNFERMGEVSFLDNDFTGGERAISWTRFVTTGDYVRSVTLCGNRFAGYTGYAAVLLEGVGNLTARGNSFEGGQRGIRTIVLDDLLFERNLVTRATDIGAYLNGTGAQVHWNAFENNARGVSITAPLSNATENWWGHPTGPSGSGRTGQGDRLANGTNPIPYEPFLDARPDLAVDCQAPVVGAPQARAPFAAGASASVTLGAHARVKEGPVNEDREIRVSRALDAGPVLLP